MTKSKLLKVFGSGPSTSYEISELGRLFLSIDAKKYCSVEPDKRCGLNRYNFNLFSSLPLDIFDENELNHLKTATEKYKKRTKNLSNVIQKKRIGKACY